MASLTSKITDCACLRIYAIQAHALSLFLIIGKMLAELQLTSPIHKSYKQWTEATYTGASETKE